MQDEYMGIVKIFAGNFAMRGYALCQGQTMAISQNAALFSILGTVYGGDGVQTFKLPDLQGRVPVGQGNGLGLSQYTLGETGGTENVSILTSNLPAHSHQATFTPSGGGTAPTVTLKASTQQATQSVPGTSGAATLAAPVQGRTAVFGYVADENPSVALTGLSVSGGTTGGGSVTVANTGSNIPVSILQPFLAVNYVICLQGVFPTRN